jgi:aminoglycoside phosphotransferase (APT) family kinase protein
MSEDVPGIDFDKLIPWFREHVAEVDSLEATVIGHGRSNLTYRMDSEGQSWVLRRPPLSHVQASAHDMNREYRVITALADTDVAVPKTYAVCDDADVIGASFFIMEHVEGLVPVDVNTVKERYTEEQRRYMGERLVDTLVALHTLDPEEVGLGDFGKPEGYIERQVRRFSDQLEKVKTRDLPELEELSRRLSKAIPENTDATIVHGDYRLDNTMVNDDGNIAAVLDWEMSTLGDPLADMGILRMYWRDRADAADGPAVGNIGVITQPGFPSWDEGRARYEEKSGRSLGNLDFYIALANFKLGVILENMHARFKAGGTVGAGFELIGNQVLLLARTGLAVADASSIPALRGE